MFKIKFFCGLWLVLVCCFESACGDLYFGCQSIIRDKDFRIFFKAELIPVKDWEKISIRIQHLDTDYQHEVACGKSGYAVDTDMPGPYSSDYSDQYASDRSYKTQVESNPIDPNYCIFPSRLDDGCFSVNFSKVEDGEYVITLKNDEKKLSEFRYDVKHDYGVCPNISATSFELGNDLKPKEKR